MIKKSLCIIWKFNVSGGIWNPGARAEFFPYEFPMPSWQEVYMLFISEHIYITSLKVNFNNFTFWILILFFQIKCYTWMLQSSLKIRECLWGESLSSQVSRRSSMSKIFTSMKKKVNLFFSKAEIKSWEVHTCLD